MVNTFPSAREEVSDSDWRMAVRSGGAASGSGYLRTSYGRLHYRHAGSGTSLGPAILLFHINRQSSALYEELIGELAGAARVLAMDYPSYGGSDHLSCQPAIRDYARAAAELLDGLAEPSGGKGRALLLGEAVGAAVAVEFARTFPERTSGVVLLNCPILPDRAKARAFVQGVKDEATPSGSEFEAEFAGPAAFLARNATHAPLAPTASWLARVRQARLDCGADCWQAANALLDFDLLAALGDLSCPALLLTGAQSPFRGGHDAVVAAVPQIEATVLPDARFAIGWERAAEVARRVLAFTRTAAPEGVLSSLRVP